MRRPSIDHRTPLVIVLIVIAALAAASIPHVAARTTSAGADAGLFFVNYRNLGDGADGVALLNLDPESPDFGRLLQSKEIGQGVLPHHLYFNRDESRLYTTALGGAGLYEVVLDQGRDRRPTISRIVPIATGGSQVGENMYFSRDGSRYYVTFMGGLGADVDGTVGVFDARTNRLLQTIRAQPDAADPSRPFIMHPHGISANEDLGLMMVTSTAHPSFTRNFGSTVSTIDLATGAVVRTQQVADAPGAPSMPVEVLMLRDGLPPFALASTLGDGDIWVAPYDAASGAFGDFAKQVDGSEQGLGVALEFYVHANHHGERELYVSFGVPGVVRVYSLDNLPALTLKRTLQAGPGAHHMAFFTTGSGRELMVVQNNLLNLDGLNGGTLSVIDPETGEQVATLDMAGDYGLMPESIESAGGHGADMHH